MKVFWIFCLAATALWLGLSQARVERKLETLEADNQRLSEELANGAGANPEALREAQARLTEAQSALNNAERRLSNLTSQMENLQQRMQWTAQSASANNGARAIPVTEPRSPASSHSPAGELLDRHWGPEQVVGPPNTGAAGDIPTAWASREPDGGEEWLRLEYERPLDLAEVRVRETYNPGAISKVTAFVAGGQEVTIWEGQEPAAQAPVDTSFPVTQPIQASSVKLYLDTRRVPGWNEIDAVEVVGRDGTHQWAKAATASSTYAEP